MLKQGIRRFVIGNMEMQTAFFRGFQLQIVSEASTLVTLQYGIIMEIPEDAAFDRRTKNLKCLRFKCRSICFVCLPALFRLTFHIQPGGFIHMQIDRIQRTRVGIGFPIDINPVPDHEPETFLRMFRQLKMRIKKHQTDHLKQIFPVFFQSLRTLQFRIHDTAHKEMTSGCGLERYSFRI